MVVMDGHKQTHKFYVIVLDMISLVSMHITIYFLLVNAHTRIVFHVYVIMDYKYTIYTIYNSVSSQGCRDGTGIPISEYDADDNEEEEEEEEKEEEIKTGVVAFFHMSFYPYNCSVQEY